MEKIGKPEKKSTKTSIFLLVFILALMMVVFSSEVGWARTTGYVFLSLLIFSYLVNWGKAEKTVLFAITWLILLFWVPLLFQSYLRQETMLRNYLEYFYDNLINIVYIVFSYDFLYEDMLLHFVFYIIMTFLFAGFISNFAVLASKIILRRRLDYGKNISEIKSTLSYGMIIIVSFTISFVVNLYGPQVTEIAEYSAVYEYKQKNDIPDSEHFCRLIGGRPFGTWMGYEKCYPPASDAGKPCTDDDQCESSLCVVANKKSNQGKCFEYKETDFCNTPRHINDNQIIEEGMKCLN